MLTSQQFYDIQLSNEEEEGYYEEVDTTEEEELKKRDIPLRDYLYFMLETPTYNVYSLFYSLINVIAILSSSFSFLIGTLPTYELSPPSAFSIVEILCIILFSIDYTTKLMLTRSPKGYWVLSLMNLIDLLAILPFYIEYLLSTVNISGLVVLRILRLFRVVRLFKLLKHSSQVPILAEATIASGPGLSTGLFFLSSIVTITSTLVYFVETNSCVFDPYDELWKLVDTGEPTPFQSIPHTMWWSLVTLGTVGYGESVPETPLGKFMAAISMFCGPFVLTYPITILGDSYSQVASKNLQISQFAGGRKSVRKKILENPKKAIPVPDLLDILKMELVNFHKRIHMAQTHMDVLEHQFVTLEENVRRLSSYVRRYEYAKKLSKDKTRIVQQGMEGEGERDD